MDALTAVFSRLKTMNADPDGAVLARCRAGDTEAFRLLVDRYQGMVSGLVARTLHDPEDTADVTQEIFVQAYRALNSFRADARFSTWLYRIALNTAMRHAGKAARERKHRVEPDPDKPEPLEQVASDPQLDPEAVVWRDISHDVIRSAVHALPVKHREVVILHYFEGKSCEEAAEILGINVGTVWSRIHYAVRKLRETLKDQM